MYRKVIVECIIVNKHPWMSLYISKKKLFKNKHFSTTVILLTEPS